MRKIRFRGFPAGSVALTVSQGDFSASAETIWPETEDGGASKPISPPGGTVEITASRTEGVAPAGIVFSATAAGWDVPRPYHDLRYRWTFDDPGVYERFTPDLPWDRVYDVGGSIRIVRGWDVYAEDGLTYVATLADTGGLAVPKGGTYLGLDRNIAYGPHAAHTFTRPGEYTVRCEVLSRAMVEAHLKNGGTVHDIVPVVAEAKVLIEATDEAFPGERTICVSAAGDFAEKPQGAAEYTSVEAAEAYIRGRSKNYRVLLRRGETFDVPSLRWRCNDLHLGAFGPEADGDAVYGSTAGLQIDNDHGGTVTLTGLEIRGPYDPTDTATMTLENHGTAAIELMGGPVKPHFPTIHDCRIWRWGRCIDPGNTRNIVVSDTIISDWGNYGVLSSADDAGGIHFCGSALTQNPETKNGGGAKEYVEPAFPDHGPIRLARMAAPVSFHLCDVWTMNGWGTSGTAYDDLYYDIQPPWRLNVGANSGYQEVFIERVREVGGAVGAFLTNERKTAEPMKYVFEKIYHMTHGLAGGAFSTLIGGVTFRNNTLVKADLPNGPPIYDIRSQFSRPGGDHFLSAALPKLYSPENVIEPVRYYHLTLVDLRRNMQEELIEEDIRDFSDMVSTNHVMLAPGYPAPVDEDGPLDTTVALTSPVAGYIFENEPIDTAWVPDPSSYALYYPKDGSKAIGTAQTDDVTAVAIDDFFGRLRGLTPSRGAVEPA
jgi:hypothetical protein